MPPPTLSSQGTLVAPALGNLTPLPASAGIHLCSHTHEKENNIFLKHVTLSLKKNNNLKATEAKISFS